MVGLRKLWWLLWGRASFQRLVPRKWFRGSPGIRPVRTRSKDFEGARPMVDEAIALADDSEFGDALGKVLIERGVELLESARIPDAVAAFDQVTRLRPKWPFPLYQRAWAHLLRGDNGSALDDFRACAALSPVFFTVQREIRSLEDVAAGRLSIAVYRRFNAARTKLASDPLSVEHAAARMVATFPDFAPGHLLRGEARLRLGDVEGALASVESALQCDPDSDTASNAIFLAWSIARQRGDTTRENEARERLTTAYREHPAAQLMQRSAEIAAGRTFRWTYTFDGRLIFQQAPSREDRSDRPPESPR